LLVAVVVVQTTQDMTQVAVVEALEVIAPQSLVSLLVEEALLRLS
jgi:hypothetical protein